ncbi:YozQ family protein [Brevibacillus sp. H7]|uniref:YozQ family protein n=1 Tax=Brevibacillus sp. H7 TaxID=3349138 RepID=UPI003804028B
MLAEQQDQSKPRFQSEVATKNYDSSDYEANSELSQGLADTHEQVSDMYKVGTIDDRFPNNQESE